MGVGLLPNPQRIEFILKRRSVDDLRPARHDSSRPVLRFESFHGQPPEILSDHPSDERSIARMEEWVPLARGAKRAYDEGNIAPARR